MRRVGELLPWALLGLLGYGVYRLRASLRGNRPADENTAYAVANRILSTDRSSIGSGAFDWLHPDYTASAAADAKASPSYDAATGYVRHPDGYLYAPTVAVFDRAGQFVRELPQQYVPPSYTPKPVFNPVLGKFIVLRVIQP